MKRLVFLNNCEKLKGLEIFPFVKGKYAKTFGLGYSHFGSTKRQFERIWRDYGTLENLLIFKTADEVNLILTENDIKGFKAVPTKNKLNCRIKNDLD